jgi:uncharacterized membrane protein YgcG
MRNYNLAIVSGVLLSAVLYGCSSVPLLKSTWNNNQIVVDGKEDDWKNETVYLSDQSVILGVRNDTSDIYVLFKTSSRQQSYQILGRGLTVWFDPSGGKDKIFGIHFPLGRTGQGEYREQSGEEGQENQEGTPQPTETDLEVIDNRQSGPVQLTPVEAKGIELNIKNYDDYLVYEMKIPLHSSEDHPYAINVKGKSIGLGFEGGTMQARSSGEERSGEGGGYGGEGGGGGYGGGFGGRHGGGRRGGGGREGGGERPKPIDFWLKVDLAQNAPPAVSFQ